MGQLYSSLKIFHYKDKLDSLPESSRRILPPLHIRIKPTNACGHRCWYCAYTAGNLQLGRNMNKEDFIPKEKMMEILDDIIEMDVKAITFSGGGDPFCYPYLAETFGKLSESPIAFASLTNGSRLSGEAAEILARKGSWVRISMDGWDDKSYAEYRQVSDREFTKIMGNIESFRKIDGKCRLGVSLVVDTKNASHVYEFTRTIRDSGVQSIKISPCVVSDSVNENNTYHAPHFKLVNEQIEKAITDFSSSTVEIHHAFHEFNDYQKEYSWCPYQQVLTVIGADCNVYTCQDKAYNTEDGLLGSIRTKRLRDFWFADKSIFFRTNPSKHCNHHCVANSKNKLILEYLESDKEHLGFV